MVEPPGLLAPRERRWLLIFLVLASAYVGLLLAARLLEIIGGFHQILLIVFLAWLLAFVMAPVVDAIAARLPISRAVTVIATYAALFVALGFGLFYSGAAITQQLTQLTTDFPETDRRIQATLAGWQESLHFGRLEIDLVALYEGMQRQVETIGGAIFSEAQAIAGVTVAAIAAFVLIVVLSMYMVMDRTRILAKIARVVPNRYETELRIFERSVARAFGGFLRAQILLAVMQAALVGIIGGLFGMPFLVLVGTLSAIAMLIPFFGPPLALIPPIVATAIYIPDALLVVAALLIAIQTVAVNWLQPRLMQGALGLHPILVLVGLLVGAQVAGVWGALFGIPVIAVANVFFNYLLNLRTLAESEESDAGEAVAQALRDAPGATPELAVALAAKRAEDQASLHAAAHELRDAAVQLHDTAEHLGDEGRSA